MSIVVDRRFMVAGLIGSVLTRSAHAQAPAAGNTMTITLQMPFTISVNLPQAHDLSLREASKIALFRSNSVKRSNVAVLPPSQTIELAKDYKGFGHAPGFSTYEVSGVSSFPFKVTRKAEGANQSKDEIEAEIASVLPDMKAIVTATTDPSRGTCTLSIGVFNYNNQRAAELDGGISTLPSLGSAQAIEVAGLPVSNSIHIFARQP